MSKSSLFNLTNDVKEELHFRLRTSNYSGFIELETWLRSLGYKTSKSAIHRYSQNLKELDGFEGRSGSHHLAVQINTK